MRVKDFNLRCDKLKKQLTNIIDNSGLPIAAIYYIWKTLDKDVQQGYYAALNRAFAQEQKTVEEVKQE